jgi:hypothetical protein
VDALEPLADALLADGYELRATETGERTARVEVVATPDACADCLVPPDVFGAIIRTRLSEVLSGAWAVEVVYPADTAADGVAASDGGAAG